MADAGFPGYTTPLDAIGDPKWRPAPGASTVPSPEQIATASADVGCKIKTNLVGVGLAIQSSYDQQYIQRDAEDLAAYRAKIAAYLAHG